MIEQATRAGIPKERFWGLTLREVSLEVRAKVAHETDLFRRAQFTAWWTEAYARTKKLPDLARILQPAHELTSEQRAAAQLSKLRAMAMACGGQLTEIKH